MTSTILAKSLITDALAKLSAATGQLRELRQGHQAALGQLRDQAYALTSHQHTATATVPVMTPEGRAQFLRERTPAIAAEWKTRLDALRAQIDEQIERVDRLTGEHWPTPTAGVEAMLARQAMWARSRSLLEAGVNVAKVIGDTTDLEALFALRDELPTWAQVKGADSDTTTRIVKEIDRRIAEVASSTPGHVDLTSRFEARALAASLAPILDLADTEISGTATGNSGLQAALESRMAGQAARAEHNLDIPTTTNDSTGTTPTAAIRANIATQMGSGVS